MSSDTGRPRVLVVDDDPRILEALRRALTLKGFGVSTADGGQAALSLLGLGAPDVLCSTWRCRTSTASRSARACARPATARRCSC
jgi:DNA-binding response OmpR family regulator